MQQIKKKRQSIEDGEDPPAWLGPILCTEWVRSEAVQGSSDRPHILLPWAPASNHVCVFLCVATETFYVLLRKSPNALSLIDLRKPLSVSILTYQLALSVQMMNMMLLWNCRIADWDTKGRFFGLNYRKTKAAELEMRSRFYSCFISQDE